MNSNNLQVISYMQARDYNSKLAIINQSLKKAEQNLDLKPALLSLTTDAEHFVKDGLFSLALELEQMAESPKEYKTNTALQQRVQQIAQFLEHEKRELIQRIENCDLVLRNGEVTVANGVVNLSSDQCAKAVTKLINTYGVPMAEIDENSENSTLVSDLLEVLRLYPLSIITMPSRVFKNINSIGLRIVESNVALGLMQSKNAGRTKQNIMLPYWKETSEQILNGTYKHNEVQHQAYKSWGEEE